MTNGTEKAPEIVEAVEENPPARAQFLGGEVHITADAATGGITVKSPPNLLLALGIIETAKAILIQQHTEAMQRAARPAIVRAGPQDIPKLHRPS